MIRGFLIGLAMATGFVATAAGTEVLWGVTGVGGAAASLYAVNPATGAVVGKSATGVDSLSGVAVHPTTGVMYATETQRGTGLFYRIDSQTGKATQIGTVGFAIAETAFQPTTGDLYAWAPLAKKLYKINLTTGTPTQLASSPSTVGPSAITFGTNGVLYMVRNNSLITVNSTTGALATGPLVIKLGAVDSDVDNLFATNAAGVLYCGRRSGKSAPTSLFTINAATAALTKVADVSGVAFSGMTFGTAAAPTAFRTPKKTVRVTGPVARIKGTVSSALFTTVSAPGARARTVQGRWTLNVKVKPGRRVLTLTCKDDMGQAAAPLKVVVIRG